MNYDAMRLVRPKQYTPDAAGTVVLPEDSNKSLSVCRNMSSVKICEKLKTFTYICENYLNFILKIRNIIQYCNTLSHLYKTI